MNFSKTTGKKHVLDLDSFKRLEKENPAKIQALFKKIRGEKDKSLTEYYLKCANTRK